jgi:hypothetical protein
MAFFEDIFKGSIGSGLVLGIGAVILAPIMIPAVRNVAKPLAKAAIKGTIMVYEKGRELMAEGAEVVEDIYIEAQAELAESRKVAAEAGETRAPQQGAPVADPA